MQITFTDEAAAAIGKRHFNGNGAGALKLAYDAEGCGCAVDGVAALWIVDEPGETDELADSNVFTVYFDRRHELFFEEKLTVDFRPDQMSFVLKSAGQTYNPAMRIEDRRSAGSAASHASTRIG